MNKHNQNGFVGLVVIAVLAIGLVVAGAVVVLRTQSDTKSTETAQNQPPSTSESTQVNEPAPMLQNLGLNSLGDDVVIDTHALREFEAHGLKGFYIFGDVLPGNRLNPNFEYASVKDGASVIAVTSGVITHIEEQAETNDFEVFLQPASGSTWTIGYDHLTSLAVKEGDSVQAGDSLGAPAQQNNGLLRFELQINQETTAGTIHHCPASLLETTVKEIWLAQLNDMMNNWESVGNLELYDPALQNPLGCLYPTLTPAQAEGR